MGQPYLENRIPSHPVFTQDGTHRTKQSKQDRTLCTLTQGEVQTVTNDAGAGDIPTVLYRRAEGCRDERSSNPNVRGTVLQTGQANKGAGRMPRHQEPKKDAISCEKPGGAANGL